MTGDPGFVGLVVSLSFVAVVVALSVWQRLGLEGTILWAATRAFAQLMLVGGVLVFVLDADQPLVWASIWIVAMVFFAAGTVHRRLPTVPGLFTLSLGAFGVASLVTLGVLFGLGVFDLTARALVPLAGMMVGNSMNATILATRSVVGTVQGNREEVEAKLSLGLPAQEVARPFVRRALRTGLTPQIESTKAVGIVFLPGAMTGMILAGADPLEAVRLQVVIMYMVLGAVGTTTAVVGLGTARKCFSRDHRLVRFPPDPSL